MGRQLAREAPVDADLVIGVPDSGVPSAVGYAQESGIPFDTGLVKKPLRRPDVHSTDADLEETRRPTQT